ncbi:MAG: AAA family ATPase [Clostridiales bacterium]|nr:AAA family ATPase [Clostridiales bacterium]
MRREGNRALAALILVLACLAVMAGRLPEEAGLSVERTKGAVGAVCAVAAVLLLTRRRAPGLAAVGVAAPQTGGARVTFDDVAVSDEAMGCLEEIADFLRSPEKYADYGARLPRGVLLYGPPGTGKTLMARALAGEAGVPFFAVNGADFVQMYVGVGASRVRELFKKARKAGRGVIFIDEIDAIGKKRDNANDEREQTLNALLTEMSGFSPAEGIVVLGATNRLDTLDEALLRAGRFDRHVQVGLPDRAARARILRVHARNKPLDAAVSLDALAAETVLFSGAQLETLLNEAAIRAARRGDGAIGQEDVDKAYLTVLVGGERKTDAYEKEKRITAYHEAGHALAARALQPGVRVARISILPTGNAAGFALTLPEEKMFQTRSELMAAMATALAGRAAEEMIFGREQVTTGAAGDIQRARSIAGKMAGEWEMGEQGDLEGRLLFDAAYRMARRTLEARREQLDRVAEALLRQEQLTERAFEELCN